MSFDMQVNELKSRLTEMEERLLEVREGHDKLEQLNSAWAQKNLELTDQLNQLQVCHWQRIFVKDIVACCFSN